MTAFHVSTKQYKIGEIISSNNYLDITQRRGNKWVEELLENYRPRLYPNRLKCVFSFAKIEALAFYSDYLNSNDLNYYEVELLNNPISCPMILCGYIQKNKNEDSDLLSKLAVEYWSKMLDWNFLELLCDSFKIVHQLNKPNISDKVLGMGMYEKDKKIAKTIK